MEEELHVSQTFVRRIFGIGPKLMSMPASRLIHPNSPFQLGLTVVSSLFLFYTAVVTPFLVAFFWNQSPCDMSPTIVFDMVVDAFFLCEILITFGTGIRKNGAYVDDWKVVFQNYARGMLCFDVVTSTPVSLIEYLGAQACGDESQSEGGSQLRFIRIIKPLRLFKLLRVSDEIALVSEYSCGRAHIAL